MNNIYKSMRIFWILSILFVTLQANNCSGKLNQAQLYGTWFHSFEEDEAGDIKAYRPSTYDFPLARGRTGFTIGKDGDFTLHEIAPTDGLISSKGKWRMKDDKTIEVIMEKKDRHFEIEVLSVDENFMRVKTNLI